MTLEPNILFDDRYRLIEMKGRGTFGEVWLAHDEQLDMDVALKAYIALDDRGVAEFKSEYKTAAGLNHPNLLHANHFALCDKRPYLVMPFCPGSAAKLVGNVDEDTLWRFIRDVAAGLAYLHEMDIVHHDIKPDNILMDTEDNFLITDFGISTKMRSTLRRNSARDMSESKALGGSLSYMGPEMFAANAESVKSTDIWALGATLYEMATGELPFFGQGGVMQMNGAQIPDIPLKYSDDFAQVVSMCLAKDTWERPLASQLEEYARAKMGGKTLDDLGVQPLPKVEQQSNVRSTVQFNAAGTVYHSNGGYRSDGGYHSDSGYHSNGGAPEATVVATKKKSKAWIWILGIVGVLIVAGVVVFTMLPRESPEEKLARENVTTYLNTVSSCEKNIQIGSYEDYKPLLTARNEMEEIQKLEDAGKMYVPETYNHYSLLKSQLDSKCKQIGQEYEQLAMRCYKQFEDFGDEEDKTQALKYFNITKELIPDFDSETYRNLRK